jgi:peptidoglycan/LPS O-acetylase OafA/YrhL
MLAWPLVALAVWRRRRGVLACTVLVALPPLVEWVQRRPRLDPVRWSLASLVDDMAYGAGVWSGCLRWRSLGPLLPTVRSVGVRGTESRAAR